VLPGDEDWPESYRDPVYAFWFDEGDGPTLHESEIVQVYTFSFEENLILIGPSQYNVVGFSNLIFQDITEWEGFQSKVLDARHALDFVKI